MRGDPFSLLKGPKALKREDFYSILEVDKKADAETIRSAYRRLARRLHPDVTDDVEAHERFRRLGEAYRVLSDEKMRRQYDMLSALSLGIPFDRLKERFGDKNKARDLLRKVATGLAFAAGLFSNREKQPGRDLKLQEEISFAQSYIGTVLKLAFHRPVACAECKGTGFSQVEPCDACSGCGRLESKGFPGIRKRCPRCEGRGWQGVEKCEPCDGAGRRTIPAEVKLKVPAGVHDGQRLRVKGMGEQGRGFGGAGKPGDLIVALSILPDPVLKRNGKDIHAPILVDFHAAVQGGQADFSLPGRELSITIPPLSWPGRRIRAEGAGFPDPQGGTAGDCFLTLEIKTPDAQDEKEILSMYIQKIKGPEDRPDEELENLLKGLAGR